MIDWDAPRGMARFVRTALPYATIGDIEADGREVEHALEALGGAKLLVDLRAVTPRNDASFEAAIARFRKQVFGGRRRIAVLVRTAVGALQVKRHMREDGTPGEVFTDEQVALAFLDHRSSQRGLW